MAEQDLYTLLDHHATAEEIRAVLRMHKPDFPRDIQVSGTKEQILQQLRTAVAERRIPLSCAQELLREAEENGDQHVFYFKPLDDAVLSRCRDGHEVAKAIWGEGWEGATAFPRYTYVPLSYEWADFRVGLPRKPQDWCGKIYGHETRLKQLREERRAGPDGEEVVKVFKPEDVRAVCLARWNAPDLLELRVPRCESRASLTFRLDRIWNRLQPALQREEFHPWSLDPARRCLLESRAANAAVYQTSSTRLTDSASGRATFAPRTDDEHADEVAERGLAIDAYLRAGCGCEQLTVTWLASGSGGILAQDLRVVIGARYPNEVVIAAQTTSQAVDYVTNQLRRYGG